MPTLEYLLIFKKTGIPIYSRCFGRYCGVLMRDDVLLTGFLSALTAIQHYDNSSDLTFEGEKLEMEFEKDGNLSTVTIGPSKLVFSFVETLEYYIVSGFPIKDFNYKKDKHLVDKLNTAVKSLLDTNYTETSWERMSYSEIEMFEKDLLKNAVHPWMKTAKSSHTCMLGNYCPFRIAILKNRDKGIVDGLKFTYTDYRSKSIFSLLRMMMSGIRQKMTPIRA